MDTKPQAPTRTRTRINYPAAAAAVQQLADDLP
jgi:hypothetical protein